MESVLTLSEDPEILKLGQSSTKSNERGLVGSSLMRQTEWAYVEAVWLHMDDRRADTSWATPDMIMVNEVE